MSRPRNTPRFDLLTYSLSLLFVGFCSWQLAQRTRPPVVFADEFTLRERARLERTFGPQHHSQLPEEWITRDFFRYERGGVFVDVGANHYRDGSTPYYLEQRLGWSRIAIDTQEKFAAEYRKYRPRTRFFPFFLSNVSSETAKRYMTNFEGQGVSADEPLSSIVLTTTVEAPTIASTDLFDRQAVPAIDFLSINVELSEPRVLDGFAVGRFRRRLVCKEAQAEVRQQILEFFTRHSYAVIGKYLGVDTANLCFIPWNGFAPRFLRRTANFWVVWRSASPGGTATGAASAPDTAPKIASRMSSRATSLPRDPILTGASTSRSS
jgi:hypothetical protein